MNERIKEYLTNVIETSVYETEPYENKNDELLVTICSAIGERNGKIAISLVYEICQRHGFDKKEFIKRVEKERCRQEKLHPYNENTNYEMIAIEELGESVKAYNDLDENGMIEELIQFASVIVRMIEIGEY